MAAIKYVAATLQRILPVPPMVQEEGYGGEENEFIYSKMIVRIEDILESRTRKLINPAEHAMSRKGWFAWQKIEMPDWTIFHLHKENEVTK